MINKVYKNVHFHNEYCLPELVGSPVTIHLTLDDAILAFRRRFVEIDQPLEFDDGRVFMYYYNNEKDCCGVTLVLDV